MPRPKKIQAKRLNEVDQVNVAQHAQQVGQANEVNQAEQVDETKEEKREDCLICTEECKTALECSHYIHLKCIAQSGQNTCSICRKEVAFADEDEKTYQAARQRNEEEKKQRETAESIALAQQINTEINGRRRRQDLAVVRANNRDVQIIVQRNDGYLPADDLMLQLNQLMFQVSERQRDITADLRVINLYNVMMDLNSISAHTGLGLRELCGIIENCN
jgi:hypothetical protein